MFKIYQTGKIKPKKYGRLMRILYASLIIIPAIIVTINSFAFDGYGAENSIIDIVGLIILIGVAIILLTASWLKPMKSIGFLEINNQGIKKTIGNVVETYRFSEISSVRIEKYMRSFLINDTWRTYSRYILQINLPDSKTTLIVGDKSMKHKRVSILDTLNHLNNKNILTVKFSL